MFRKYEKTKRIVIPQFQVKGKHTLTKNEIKSLLAGPVTIEEKMDGANIGIVRHKHGFHLQKRGSLVGQSEHQQFQYFHNWANYQNYEKLMEIPVGHILYGELLYACHSIFYDSLPDYVMFFDVWNGKKYLNTDEKINFLSEYCLLHVPILTRGFFNVTQLHSLISKESTYGDISEGIVVKRYRKKEYLKGKIVKPEFHKMIEESDHWIHKEIKINVLRKVV